MYGHLNRFSKDFREIFQKKKKKHPKCSPTKQYKIDFEILKDLSTELAQDAIERDYLLAKLAAVFSKFDYFKNHPKNKRRCRWR